MNQTTRTILNQLRHSDWFRAVGKPEPKTRVMSSWIKAIESCTSIAWENIQLEAANQIRDKLIYHHIERYQLWNDIAKEVKAITTPLVHTKVASVVSKHQLPKEFEDSVNWDVMHIGISSEYADIASSQYYKDCAFWYLQGRFPCGWVGDFDDFPNGKFVIY